MTIPTAGELRKIDGVKVRAVTDKWKTIEWVISTDWDYVCIAHNNPYADWCYAIKKEWYEYGWNLWCRGKPDSYISKQINSLKILDKKPTETKYTYSTQHVRSDWVVFTQDTIDWKSLDEVREEMKSLMAKGARLKEMLRKHSTLKF